MTNTTLARRIYTTKGRPLGELSRRTSWWVGRRIGRGPTRHFMGGHQTVGRLVSTERPTLHSTCIYIGGRVGEWRHRKIFGVNEQQERSRVAPRVSQQLVGGRKTTKDVLGEWGRSWAQPHRRSGRVGLGACERNWAAVKTRFRERRESDLSAVKCRMCVLTGRI